MKNKLLCIYSINLFLSNFAMGAAEPSYREQLKQHFNDAGTIDEKQLVQFLENKRLNCQTPETNYSMRNVEVKVETFIVGENSPLFPTKKYQRILGPLELRLSLDKDRMIAMSQEQAAKGFKVSLNNADNFYTEYREKDGMVFFYSDFSYEESDCWEPDNCRPPYCRPICHDVAQGETMYGYCFIK